MILYLVTGQYFMMNFYRAQLARVLTVHLSRLNPVLLEWKRRRAREHPRDQVAGGKFPGRGFEQVHGPAGTTSGAWSSMEASGDYSADRGARLLSTRSVHGGILRFVVEAGYPCGPVSESVNANKGSEG